jgi:hypothetical protein
VAVIVQRAFDLSVWLIRKAERFPRSLRFSIGERLIARSLDVLETVTEAAYSADKLPLLERANRQLNGLRILVRVSRELELIGGDSHSLVAEKLEEIGRMIGGWRKANVRRNEAPH